MTEVSIKPLAVGHRIAFKIIREALLQTDNWAQIESLARALLESNATGIVNAMITAMERNGLSDQDVEALLRTSLSALRGKKIPQAILNHFEDVSGARLHYSQEGEDIVLRRILPEDKVGFFVDIGAYHPLRFSNTYALYRKGWRGINVDATPGSMNAFNRLRPEDLNIECAVSNSSSPMIFHIFKEQALNTFDASLAKQYIDSGWELERRIEIRPRMISAILDDHVPKGKHIDLLSIDVEGRELEVLQSNNWHSYCPDLIILEVLAVPFASLKSHPAITFLADKGYELISRLMNSVILHHRA